MVPLDTAAAKEVIRQLGPPTGPGLLALRHALEFCPRWLWGDLPSSPRSILLIREGDDQIEAFGTGVPEPAVGWLTSPLRPFTLHAPESWLDAVLNRVGAVDQDTVEIWSLGEITPPGIPAPGRVITERLTAAHSSVFRDAAPSWALRGWQSYSALNEQGVCFGVPHGTGFAALAWVFDQADSFDALGVYTTPRYRRLGLGRAAVSALIEHIVGDRKRSPIWYVAPANGPSRELAQTLGFELAATEPLVRWPPRAGDA